MSNARSEMTSSRTIAALLAFALGLLSLAGTASAQPHPDGTGPGAGTSPEPADAMPMSVSEVEVSSWDELGDRRYRHADALEPWQHEERARALWTAAHLHLHSGEEIRALRELEKSGDAALAAGEVYRAATAYLRAAYVATEVPRMDDARRLLDRAEELRSSPRLTADQREQLDVEVDPPFRVETG